MSLTAIVTQGDTISSHLSRTYAGKPTTIAKVHAKAQPMKNNGMVDANPPVRGSSDIKIEPKIGDRNIATVNGGASTKAAKARAC
ncbi:hypothetical protein [Mesorhizobium sp. YR577]|uniref:hypothetical protein n=1 Tax=Mesorhizobium sp. YR577 TaxID=1884373 RepID=UPI001114F9A4|nr:hypothetical protein [Mesorhizobium sp. YR577]